ncbi:MAG: hypothetical protein ACKOCN_12560 [Planctomycetaceae bacterium]
MQTGFVPHAAARVRLVRCLFVAACLVPSIGLGAWGLHLRGSSHREAVLRKASEAMGLRVTAEAMDHLRPGVLRLRGVRIDSAAISLESLMIERADHEIRVSVPRWSGSVESFRSAVGFLRNWLNDPLRCPFDWVIDIGDIVITPSGMASTGEPSDGAWSMDGARVECVAGDDTRAVRIRREPFDGDEVRFRLSIPDPGADSVGDGPACSVDVDIDRPVPLEWLCAAMGWPELPKGEGRPGLFSGHVRVTLDGSERASISSGEGAFTIDGFETSCLAPILGSHAVLQGRLRLDVETVGVVGGVVDHASASVRVDPGHISRSLLEQWVQHLGCQRGDAFPVVVSRVSDPAITRPTGISTGGNGPLVAFDRLVFRLLVKDESLRFFPEGTQAIMIAPDGRNILAAPPAAVSLERVAWAFADPSASAVPLSPVTRWLFPSSEGGKRELAKPSGRN